MDHEPVTEIELAELRRRWEELPPAPWTLEGSSGGPFDVVMSMQKRLYLKRLSLSEAQTIARAREDVERLLEEIERLRKKGKRRASSKGASSRRQKRS